MEAQNNSVGVSENEMIQNSVFLTFETIHILDSISEKIWPGWNTEKLSYYMGGVGKRQLLINPYFPVPKGFEKSDSLSTNQNSVYIGIINREKKMFGSTSYAVFDGKYYRLSASHLFPFNWPEDSLITAQTALAFESFPESYHQTMIDLFHSPEFFISIQIHEGFHVYQYPKTLTMSNNTINPSFYYKPKIMVYSYLEGLLLLDALQTKNTEDLLKIINKFIIVRKEKYKHISKRKQQAEKEEEFIEGTAQYVQTKSQSILQELNYKPQFLHLQNLDYNFDKANDFKLVDSIQFVSSIKQYNIDEFWKKCYFYGQAQAYILDALCGDMWKIEAMKEDILLWDLILKYSHYTESNTIDIKDVKSEYEYDRLLKEIKGINK